MASKLKYWYESVRGPIVTPTFPDQGCGGNPPIIIPFPEPLRDKDGTRFFVHLAGSNFVFTSERRPGIQISVPADVVLEGADDDDFESYLGDVGEGLKIASDAITKAIRKVMTVVTNITNTTTTTTTETTTECNTTVTINTNGGDITGDVTVSGCSKQ